MDATEKQWVLNVTRKQGNDPRTCIKHLVNADILERIADYRSMGPLSEASLNRNLRTDTFLAINGLIKYYDTHPDNVSFDWNHEYEVEYWPADTRGINTPKQ